MDAGLSVLFRVYCPFLLPPPRAKRSQAALDAIHLVLKIVQTQALQSRHVCKWISTPEANNCFCCTAKLFGANFQVSVPNVQ